MLLSFGFFLNIIFSISSYGIAGIDREETEETDEDDKPEHLTEAVTVLGTLSGAVRTEAFIVRECKSVRTQVSQYAAAKPGVVHSHWWRA